MEEKLIVRGNVRGILYLCCLDNLQMGTVDGKSPALDQELFGVYCVMYLLLYRWYDQKKIKKVKYL